MSAFTDAQAARLASCIEQMRADAQMGRSVNTVELDQIQSAATAEVTRLRNGLAFYADPTKYPAPVALDAGTKARELLAE